MVAPARQVGEVADLFLGVRTARGQDLVERVAGDDHDAVGVADHPVTEFDRDLAHRHSRSADRAGAVLRGAGQRQAGGEHRELVGREGGDIADAAVDHEARDTAYSAAVVSTSPQ